MANSAIDIHLGHRLCKRRRQLKWTQKQLACACKLGHQQISRYEGGVDSMSAPRLWDFAEILDVSVSYFYEGFIPRVREVLEQAGCSVSSELLASKETQDLIHAYYQIDEYPRRKLLDLAKCMSGNQAMEA